MFKPILNLCWRGKNLQNFQRFIYIMQRFFFSQKRGKTCVCFICLCSFFYNFVTEYHTIISYIILFPFNFFFSNLTFFLMLDFIARKRSTKYRTIFRNFIYSLCLLILPQSPLQKYTAADPTTEHFRVNNKNSEILQQNPNVQINSLNKIIRSLMVVFL